MGSLDDLDRPLIFNEIEMRGNHALTVGKCIMQLAGIAEVGLLNSKMFPPTHLPTHLKNGAPHIRKSESRCDQ